ncbi:MAG: DNA mismatch repair protein MutS, partial [Paracoccaceae bacterium]
DEIRPRLDAVSFYFDNPSLANDVRHALRACPDIERAISRLSLGRGGPRDLGAIRSALIQSDVIFRRHRDSTLPAMLRDALAALPEFSELLSLLKRALGDDLPVWARDGGFISRGYHAELDQMRELRDEGRSLIAELQAKYVDRSNISSLKIKNNNVLGYFVEVSSSHSDHMLGAEMAAHFIHRQTTASAVRFGTTELSELEARIRRSGDLALDLERSIFADLVNSILAEGRRLSLASAALAEIDLAAALADLARAENWCRPEVDASRAFVIEGGRHPVVERALAQSADRAFVANDCDLSPETEDSACIWLLTGPNMAGKSTFLRQNAIIALLAQMGSFVPASRARIGVVTQLFSRVGASDDLARGRSTFMVEMVETAAILNQAEPGALVILDEIGRGTATYDGLSIAWATLEHLHDKNRCRTLFATHYHELTSLSSTLSGLTNTTITVREWQGDIVFLHEVHQGAADRSYGVQVARLAGLPPLVIERARHVLELLEKGDRGEKSLAASLVSDLPLFVASQSQVSTKSPEEKLASRLEGVHPDELSPIDALGLIYQLCEVLNES